MDGSSMYGWSVQVRQAHGVHDLRHRHMSGGSHGPLVELPTLTEASCIIWLDRAGTHMNKGTSLISLVVHKGKRPPFFPLPLVYRATEPRYMRGQVGRQGRLPLSRAPSSIALCLIGRLQLQHFFLHLGRGHGTRDNLDELAGNDGLASAVEENLVLGDHLAGVLGGVLTGGTGLGL